MEYTPKVHADTRMHRKTCSPTPTASAALCESAVHCMQGTPRPPHCTRRAPSSVLVWFHFLALASMRTHCSSRYPHRSSPFPLAVLVSRPLPAQRVPSASMKPQAVRGAAGPVCGGGGWSNERGHRVVTGRRVLAGVRTARPPRLTAGARREPHVRASPGGAARRPCTRRGCGAPFSSSQRSPAGPQRR